MVHLFDLYEKYTANLFAQPKPKKQQRTQAGADQQP
jgi:hypothetical protein